MKKILLTLSSLFVLVILMAQPAAKPTRVLLLGCFHFDNPGLDVAKFENVDALSARRQQEIGKILEKLRQFKPDKIFVEVPVASQQRLDSNYQLYQAGRFTLRATETHQLGYRLAKELGLGTLHAVDYTGADFPFDSLMQSAAEAKQFSFMQMIKSSIDSIQQNFNASLKQHTIGEMLLEQNDPAMTRMQVGWYFNLLVAGKEGNHVGSYLTSEWWRRNMIIYENILKRLSGKEEKILVIFGS
ncbi:MAG TPA: DUF5694 domain-containing protein, partial [Chitinophagaceae bacterium]|nr:DUF5694 domain-containing protein [Chitinophagaceae bacterium]